MKEPVTVVSVLHNLFFATRIEATGRQAGVGVTTVRPEAAVAKCRELSPRLILLDLEAPKDAGALIRDLKAEPTLTASRIVGFYPHVMDELRKAALAAGIDAVMPRSAFTNRLHEVLTGEPLPPVVPH